MILLQMLQKLIVPWLKENGYQLVTVSEMIKYKTGEDPQKGQVYRTLMYLFDIILISW